MAAPVSELDGFYVGLNAGGAWNEFNVTPRPCSRRAAILTDTSVPAIALAGNENINKSGFTGGVTAG